MTDVFVDPVIDRQLRNAEKVTHGNDRNLWVEFYVKPVQNNAETTRQGRPIFIEREYVKILMPADKNTIVDRPAHDGDRERFAQQYSNFRNKRSSIEDGTPIEEWTAISVTQAAELKAQNIHTVELLANLSDTQLQKLGMGARDLSIKAQAFLSAAADSALPQRLAIELKQRDDDIVALKEQLGAMSEQMEALLEEKAKKVKRA